MQAMIEATRELTRPYSLVRVLQPIVRPLPRKPRGRHKLVDTLQCFRDVQSSPPWRLALPVLRACQPASGILNGFMNADSPCHVLSDVADWSPFAILVDHVTFWHRGILSLLAGITKIYGRMTSWGSLHSMRARESTCTPGWAKGIFNQLGFPKKGFEIAAWQVCEPLFHSIRRPEPRAGRPMACKLCIE